MYRCEFIAVRFEVSKYFRLSNQPILISANFPASFRICGGIFCFLKYSKLLYVSSDVPKAKLSRIESKDEK